MYWKWALPCVLVPWLVTGTTFGTDLRFNRDIRGILSDACFQCHGPDAATREADLRLDDRNQALSPRDDYAVIVPGRPEASELVKRIFSNDDDQMPPPDSGLRLSQKEKSILRDWIAAGADYELHWSFDEVQPPTPPEAPGRTAIDRFIEAKLSELGLQSASPANPETQLRRLTLDITGLPPTIEELDAFLSSVEGNGLDFAYRTEVDRLLSSPRYGERMAWPWLEAARYADTDGYQNDGPREMWRWRDWVINAFNANLPFDQFTIEQLAGDLLPEATHEQLIATAFNRNHRYNSEEGIPIDEFLLENAVDRVDTTATVWMGLTLGCARCHDHKYDPLTQHDYYRLIDYFNDVAESGRAVKFGNSEPWIRTPTWRQRTRLAAFDQQVAEAGRALAELERRLDDEVASLSAEALAGPLLTHGLDRRLGFDADDTDLKAVGGEEIKLLPGVWGTSARVTEQQHLELGKVAGLIGNGRFSISLWIKSEQVERGPILSNESPNTRREGILLEFQQGHLRWNINTRWISGVSTIETETSLEPNRWYHIALTNDGTQRAGGMRIYLDGTLQDVREIRNTNSNTATRKHGGVMRIGKSPHSGSWTGQIDELRFYGDRTLEPNEVSILALASSLSDILAKEASERSDIERECLRLAYLEQQAKETLAARLSDLRAARRRRTAFWDSLPTTMIMQDLPEGRPSFVRERGVYDKLGEPVSAGTPESLTFTNSSVDSRLDFARWLVHPRHPLTPRVTVNRYWQLMFGQGLVMTAEDFGAQGQPPSHPKLLDWLASEFVRSGWDNKWLLRAILLSDVYRRSSQVTADQLRLDPNNRYLARAPRLRLPGSALRDQALFLSGLLIEKQGGPSVYPYQPANLWKEASNFRYTVGKGESLYRRSLYTYWKRTLAPPTMALLDSADREWCSVKPRRTNSPLQALTLLNDVTFAEAARLLGARFLREGGSTDAARVEFAFRAVVGRYPDLKEQELLVQALTDYRREFKAHPEDAKKAVTIGEAPTDPVLDPIEWAASTVLANLLLNLEEVTTRE